MSGPRQALASRCRSWMADRRYTVDGPDRGVVVARISCNVPHPPTQMHCHDHGAGRWTYWNGSGR